MAPAAEGCQTVHPETCTAPVCVFRAWNRALKCMSGLEGEICTNVQPFSLRSELKHAPLVACQQLKEVYGIYSRKIPSQGQCTHRVSLSRETLATARSKVNVHPRMWLQGCQNCRIIESSRLEKNSEITKPIPNPSPPCPLTTSFSATCPWFLNTPRDKEVLTGHLAQANRAPSMHGPGRAHCSCPVGHGNADGTEIALPEPEDDVRGYWPPGWGWLGALSNSLGHSLFNQTVLR